MYIIYAIVSCCAMSVDLNPDSSLADSFVHTPTINYVLMIFCCMFYNYCARRYKSEKICISALLISIFMSVTIPVGLSFDATFSSKWLYENAGQIKKTLIMIIGYLPLFYYLILVFYDFMRQFGNITKTSEEELAKVQRIPRKKRFLSIFVLLLLSYLPVMIITYPGIFMGDTDNQIVQAFPELKSTGYGISEIPREFLLSEDVSLNQHHSVVHTLLIHLFLVIGWKLFHTMNAGIFLYSVFQVLFVLTCVSYSLAYLRECGMERKYIVVCMIYYMLHPYINYSMLLITKDTVYAAVLLCCVTFLYAMLKEETTPASDRKILLAFIGMVLLRNEAVYIIILALIFMILFLRRRRKQLCIYLAIVGTFSICFFKILLPSFLITPGNVREVLSVPLQQTARYVRDHADEVTAEEKRTLSRVLEYSLIADTYNPILSDPIKILWKYDVTKADMIAYFKVWGQMLLKHPGTYVQATINNYYQYLYPCRIMQMHGVGFSEQIMGDTNEIMETMANKTSLDSTEFTFHYPLKTRPILERIMTIRSKLAHVPFVICFMQAATYNWILICLLGYAAHRRSKSGIVLLLIPLFIMLVCFVGPCNGYFGRYIFPIVFVFPVLIWMVESEIQLCAKP